MLQLTRVKREACVCLLPCYRQTVSRMKRHSCDTIRRIMEDLVLKQMISAMKMVRKDGGGGEWMRRGEYALDSTVGVRGWITALNAMSAP